MNLAAYFATGALAFGGAQAVWSLAHAQNAVRGTWMLKTGMGIASCFVLFVVVSAVACALRGRGRGLGDCVAALEAGAMVAVAVALFIVGPGNLWPIVIALDAFILGIAIALGAALSFTIRPALARRLHP